MLEPGPSAEPRNPPAPALASVASWMGVLFVLLLLVITVGGYVRLSGSGLSIPDWPIIQVGDSRSLLPPISEEGWHLVHQRYHEDQELLRDKVRRGAVGMGSLGRYPHDLATFKTMFLIEWGHRFAAALVGLVAAGCLAVILRRRELRAAIGGIFGTICALIIGQALLGGMLVKSGTATHWLFLHLGTAAAILGMLVWSILRLLSPAPPAAAPAPHAGRRALDLAARAALLATWLQLMIGALVAGSRSNGYAGGGGDQFVSQWPQMQSQWVPHGLWEPHFGVARNLLDNALLHQWLHRWFAWVVVAAMVVLFVVALRSRLGPRLRLSLRAAGTFLGIQIVLGLANVFLTHPVLISLSHLVTAMFLLASLVLVLHDVRHEPGEPSVPERSPA